MVNGHIGQAGRHVMSHVEKELGDVREHVQIQFQLMVDSIVQER
jgi:hypothetical protein